MSARVEIAATSVVLAGSFNPPIFQPAWFEASTLLGAEHARAAEERLKALGNDFLGFEVEWLEIQVTRDSCAFTTTESARHTDLRDLVVGTFTLLPNTPILALGVNRLVHYQLSSEAYGRFEEAVAPKEPWHFLTNPKLRSVRMTGERPSDAPKPGFMQVEVAPSVRIKPYGVFISVNDHYEWAEGPEMVPAEDVPAVLQSEWEAARTRANVVVSHILGT